MNSEPMNLVRCNKNHILQTGLYKWFLFYILSKENLPHLSKKSSNQGWKRWNIEMEYFFLKCLKKFYWGLKYS